MAYTPTAWQNSPSTSTPLSAAALQAMEMKAVNYTAGNGGGAISISASEPRTNTAYGTLTTPDQVQNVVLATNGLIAVWYQATWQESVSGASRAAIFLGSTQVEIAGLAAVAGDEAGNGGVVNKNVPLFTTGSGLVSDGATSGYSGNVTTGQVVGAAIASGSIGGPCYIFAAAGTYTVSVRFKATSGSVTASNRQLWVASLAFS